MTASRPAYLVLFVAASVNGYGLARWGWRRGGGHLVGLIGCLIVFGLFLFGCSGTHPAPVVVPATPTAATLGIVGQNEGFHAPIPADVLAHDCARGPAPFEYRSPQVSVAGAQALLDSVQACDHVLLDVLIERDDVALARALGAWAVTHPDRVVDLECGNELDITKIDRGRGPTTLDAEQHAAWVAACVDAIRTAGYGRRILAGAVYTLDTDSWAYLQPTIKLCRQIGCVGSLHDYDNFDLAWMQRLAQSGLAWVITETGAHSTTPTEDAGQAAFLTDACVGLTQAHVAGFFVYQGASGPSTSNLDNFGTRAYTVPGAPLRVKPADAVLTRIAGGQC